MRSLCCAWMLLFCSFTFPAKFHIMQRIFSWTTTFDIASDEEYLATAMSQFFNVSATYHLTTFEDQSPLAHAKARFLCWGTIIDLYDETGPIATMEEELFRILPWGEYKIFDTEHNLIAHAKMYILGTRFEIRLPDAPEEIYAILARPLLRLFRDAWTCEVLSDTEKIDPKLLIFLAVFQTDKDNRDRYRAQINSELRKEVEDFNGQRLL